MEWTQLFTIALGAILVNNFIFAQFLGICPFMGVSKKVDTALGMGVAVIFVMGVASAVCWPINNYILIPNKLCRKLLKYAQKQKTASGEIFLTRDGKRLSWKCIW